MNQILTYEDLLNAHESALLEQHGHHEIVSYDDLLDMQDDAIAAMCES